MINKKGFVLTETLVVTVFLVSIFTFIYVSIVPLMGKYEDMTNRKANIDIVYKLYAIRKMIYKDNNRSSIIGGTFREIERGDFADREYYDKLMEFLELDDCLLVFADNINNRLSNFDGLTNDTHDEMYEYISKYTNYNGRVLVLLDKNLHTIAHLSV